MKIKMKPDFKYNITVPRIWFTIGYADLSRVKIKNKELKINYLLFFSKKINTNDITKIETKDNVILGGKKDLIIYYKNKHITFQFYNTNSLYELKDAISKSMKL